MLAKCVNPTCNKAFQYFRDGKVYQIEVDHGSPLPIQIRRQALRRGEHRVLIQSDLRPEMVGAKKLPRRVEHFWLCGDCAGQMTVAYERGTGVWIVPLYQVRRAAAS